MSALLQAAMQVRVRRIFLEQLAPGTPSRFINTSQTPNEIDEAYDQACAEQHAIVLDNAERTGRLEDHDNKYLQRYLERKDYSVVRGTVEYGPVPVNMARAVKLEIDGLRAKRLAPADDRLIRTWPSQYGPGPGEAFWILLSSGIQSPPVGGDATRFLRVYVYGDTVGHTVAVPLNAMTATLTFYRLVDPIAYNSPPLTYTDVEDPFNDGPCYGAASRLNDKAQQRDRALHMRGLAIAAANNIIKPPPQQQQGPQQ